MGIRCRFGCERVDHVATLAAVRRAMYPDPVEAALVCELAGRSDHGCIWGGPPNIQDRATFGGS